MTVNVKSTITGERKSTRWKKITDVFWKDLGATAEEANIRKEMDDATDKSGVLINIGGFLEELRKFGSKMVDDPVTPTSAKMEGKTQAGGGLLLQEGIEAKRTHIARAVKELSEDDILEGKMLTSKGKPRYELDHVNVTPFGAKITALIDVMQNLIADVNSEGLKQGSFTERKVASTGIMTSAGSEAAVTELENKLVFLKKARAYLEKFENTTGAPTEADLKKALDKSAGEGPYSIVVTKENDVNIFKDGELGSFQLLEKSTHTKKTAFTNNLRYAINAVMTGSYKFPIDAVGDDKLNRKEQNAVVNLHTAIQKHDIDIEGSKGIESSLNKQLEDIVKGKKPKPTKAKTTQKKNFKGKVNLRKTKAVLAQLRAKKRVAKKLLAAAALTSQTKRRVRSSSSSQAKAALHLKRQINQRLSAEVRRNMGRPALINRTGQFSNSVKLMSLRSTAGGFAGDYSYTLTGGGTSKNKKGVYATFENKGVRRWPGGYNPKLLITKSIRKLAQQYTEQKFTKLRRI